MTGPGNKQATARVAHCGPRFPLGDQPTPSLLVLHHGSALRTEEPLLAAHLMGQFAARAVLG